MKLSANPIAAICFALGLTLAVPAQAQFTAMNQAIAEGAADNEAMAAFYRAREFAPIWTTEDAADRKSVV